MVQKANLRRLVRETIEDTKAAVGGRYAVAVRLAVDELLGAADLTFEAEGREALEMLAEAGTELGGRVTAEAALPGLAEWARPKPASNSLPI